MSETPDPRIVDIVAATLENAHDIVSAFDHVAPNPTSGFDLACCLAVTQEESGGRNVWGADPWNPEQYPAGLALPHNLQEQPVTEDDYHQYRNRRNKGLQPQGCGPLQLTSPAFQELAEQAGGCWVPFYNARTGFAILRRLFTSEHTPQAAFAAYNGSGPAAEAYGERVNALAEEWAHKLAAPAG